MFKIEFNYMDYSDVAHLETHYFKTIGDVSDCLNFIGRGLSSYARTNLEARLFTQISIDSNQYEFLQSWLRTNSQSNLKQNRFKGISY